MFEQSLKFFVVFFVVVDPVSLIPLFTGLTTGASTEYKRRMALKAVTISATILLLFALGGAAFLQLMGISLEAFRIFGGLLLFLLALEMVFARESGTRTSSDEAAESRRRADISVFPLAFPFIAGPGALATILLWFGRIQLPEQAGLFAGFIAAAAPTSRCFRWPFPSSRGRAPSPPFCCGSGRCTCPPRRGCSAPTWSRWCWCSSSRSC